MSLQFMVVVLIGITFPSSLMTQKENYCAQLPTGNGENKLRHSK